MRFAFMLTILVFALSINAGVQADQSDQGPPNVVLILADDLGWRDLKCYGSDVHETPHLDKLASKGMRFTNAYAPAPICSASRAAILTGRSPARLHFEFVTKPKGVKPPARRLAPPPYTRDLPLGEITLAEEATKAGYVTGFVGKWHLNEHHKRYLGWSPTHGPGQQGFGVAVETFGSHPYAKKTPPQLAAILKNGFPADEVTSEAERFIKANRDRRFFLMVSHYYVHTPVHAPTDKLLAKYRAKFKDDETNLIKRAHYGAFIETLDHYIGQVVNTIDKLGLTDRTLIVFTSDNGGHPEYASNAPLRGSKWNLYEGGIRVPLIVRWPGHVRAGSVSHTPVCGTDLLPTFCDVADRTPQAAIDGRSILPLLVNKSDGWAERPLIWHFPYYHPEKGYDKAKADIGVNDFAVSKTTPTSAIRIGRHKLIHFYEYDRDELYDLHEDISEQNNLAATKPDLAKQIRSKLLKHLKANDARKPTVPE